MKSRRGEPMKSRIMYIERKAGNLTGDARIGRVTTSKTGKTLYYKGKKFQSLKGAGFKANYVDVETGEDYWISGCRKDGADSLYGGSSPVEIDDDVRDEYWAEIRGLTEIAQSSDVERRTAVRPAAPQVHAEYASRNTLKSELPLSKAQQALRHQEVVNMTEEQLRDWIDACDHMETWPQTPKKSRRTWKNSRGEAVNELLRRGLTAEC
jgi:hypothetical protein